MTDNFATRADNAAQLLRGNLQKQGADIESSMPVEVGPDGKPPAPLPPEGSYARQALDQTRAAQQAGQPTQQQQIGDQPPAGTPEQAIDGSPAPPLTGADPLPQAETQTSSKAEQRIKELINDLRAKDQQIQQLTAQSQQSGESAAELKAKLDALTAQHEQIVQSNLEHMDPETRMQVLNDARFAERFDEMRKGLMAEIMPFLQNINQKQVNNEMMDLSNTYPAFDMQTHGQLIDMFRGKNPNCTVEQAFRAIAEPEELVTRQQAQTTAIPPVVEPGTPSNVRYAPEPEPNPEAELVEEARALRDIMRSEKPEDRRNADRVMHEHIKKRLFG